MKPKLATEKRLRWLTAFHIASLCGVSLIEIGRQVVMSQELRRDAQDALLINVAGRQRTFGQAVATSAASLLLQPDQQGRLEQGEHLRQVTRDWREEGRALLGSESAKYVPKVSAEIHRQLESVEPLLHQVASKADLLVDLALQNPPRRSEMEALLQKILKEQGLFQISMEEAVDSMQKEAEIRLKSAEHHQELLLGLLLLVVVLEAWFIFRPVVLTTQHLLRSLIHSRSELTDRFNKLNGLLNASPLAILAMDRQGNVQLWSPAAERMFGWSRDEVIGRQLPYVQFGNEIEFDKLRERLFSGEHFTGVEVLRQRRDGMPIVLSLSAAPIRDEENQITSAMAVLEDISELKEAKRALSEANEKLQQLAALDGLTGIANRRSFSERLKLELARLGRHGRPLSLALIDVDLFKLFNDSYGHPAGDVVLHRVAQIISVGARTTDLVARYGGEEFAVILPETDVAGALQVAHRICRAVREGEWSHRRITVSVGVATLHSAEAKLEQLLEAADGALYQAKREGRDRVVAVHYAAQNQDVG